MLSTLSCCGGVFFFLTGVRTICLWQLGSWKLGVFGNYFSNTAPGHFLRASVIMQAQSLWTEVPVNSGDEIVVTEIVYKKTALFRPPFGSWGDQSLRESWFPGQWNRGMCLSKHERPWVSALFPLKHHTNTGPGSSLQGPQHTAEGAQVLGGCTVRNEPCAGNPSIMRRLGLLSLACKSWDLDATRNPDPSQNVRDGRHFNRVQQRAPGRLCQPPLVPKWDPSLLSLQGRDSIPC